MTPASCATSIRRLISPRDLTGLAHLTTRRRRRSRPLTREIVMIGLARNAPEPEHAGRMSVRCMRRSATGQADAALRAPPVDCSLPSAAVLGACADLKHSIAIVRHRHVTVKQWCTALRGPDSAQKHPTHWTSESRASPSKTRRRLVQAEAPLSEGGSRLSEVENFELKHPNATV